jgi:hypothetical protein
MQPPHEELVGLDLVAAGIIDSLPRLPARGSVRRWPSR